MKLVQRFVLGFYRAKFKSIAWVSPRKAANAAFKLFCTPYSRNKRDEPTPIFEIAEKLSLQIDNTQVTGFKWKPAVANNYLILICHGFDSCSFRFSVYISALLNEGFEVIAFDAPAHGVSEGSTITIVQYANMIKLINAVHGPLYGIMAHSLGGLAVVLALEQMPDNKCQRLVLIAPSTDTTHAVDQFLQYLKIERVVKKEFYQIIEDLDGNPVSWYSVARAIEQIKIATLWIHDKKDSITPFKHMEHLLTASLPHITFEVTEGLGHSPYRNAEIQQRIISFFIKRPDSII